MTKTTMFSKFFTPTGVVTAFLVFGTICFFFGRFTATTGQGKFPFNTQPGFNQGKQSNEAQGFGQTGAKTNVLPTTTTLTAIDTTSTRAVLANTTCQWGIEHTHLTTHTTPATLSWATSTDRA